MTLKYSAGLISQSFWLAETREIIKLKKDGTAEEEIKKMCVEEDLFNTQRESYSLRIYRDVTRRLKNIDNELIDLFLSSDISTQKLINLYLIAKMIGYYLSFYLKYTEKNILLELSLYLNQS